MADKVRTRTVTMDFTRNQLDGRAAEVAELLQPLDGMYSNEELLVTQLYLCGIMMARIGIRFDDTTAAATLLPLTEAYRLTRLDLAAEDARRDADESGATCQ
jgi:hypothetical protein